MQNNLVVATGLQMSIVTNQAISFAHHCNSFLKEFKFEMIPVQNIVNVEF